MPVAPFAPRVRSADLPSVATLNATIFGCDPAVNDDPAGGFDRALEVLQQTRNAANDNIAFRLVTCGSATSVQTLAPGIVLHSLAATRQPSIPRTASAWQIADLARGCDLIHLWRFDWRICDAALLAAKVAGVPVLMNDVEADFATLASQLGLARLVDRKISLGELLAERGGDALWCAYCSLVPAVCMRGAA